jgi:parallel beta-helix repeat protein
MPLTPSTFWPAALAIPLWLAPALAAASPTAAGELSLRANFETVAVTLPYTGDDNRNNSARTFVRRGGENDWNEVHPLARAQLGSERRLAGVIIGLEPGTEYEVRTTVEDPDGGQTEVSAQIRTRDDAFPGGGGATIHVASDGSEGGAGTDQDPLRTIQSAIDRAGAGDVVLVHEGVYRESVVVTSGGTADAYLELRAAGPGVVLDGSDPDVAAGLSWNATGTTSSGMSIYSAPAPAGLQSLFAYVDGERLFTYETLAELTDLGADTQAAQSLTAGFYGDSLGGFVQEGDTLHLVTRDGADPTGNEVAVARLPTGVTVVGTSHVIVDGFAVRYYGPTYEGGVGRGIEVVDSSNVVVRDNRIHGSPWGIRVRRSTRITVENNEVWDNLSYALDWAAPYGAYENATAHNQGISIEGSYEDHVLRHNVVRGFVDGIVVSDGSGARCENFDIHGNEVTQARDDAVELDCDDVTGKVWSNVIHENHSAISISGCDVGPLFVFGNVVYRYFNESYKLHPRDEQGPVFIYHNTNVSGWADLGDDAGRGIEIEMNPDMGYVSDHYITFLNNIFAGAEFARVDGGTAPRPDTYLFDYDCWYSSSPDKFFSIGQERYDDLASYVSATGMEEHGVEGDPRFVDPVEFDLHLRDDSPCKAAGVPIPGFSDHLDNPDMGAYFDPDQDPGPDDGDDGDDGDGTGDDGDDGDGDGDGDDGSSTDDGSGEHGGDGGGSDEADGAGSSGCGCGAGAPAFVSMLLVPVAIRRRRS